MSEETKYEVERNRRDRERLGRVSDRWHRDHMVDAFEVPWLIDKAHEAIYPASTGLVHTRGEEVMRAIIAARQAALERGVEPDHVLVPAGDERALADHLDETEPVHRPRLNGRLPDELRLFGMRVILARTSEVIAWRAAR